MTERFGTDLYSKEVSDLYWGSCSCDLTKQNHTTDLCCLNRDCSQPTFLYDAVSQGDLPTYVQSIVGIKPAPLFIESRTEAHLAAIIECPCCFEKFWTHISTRLAQQVINSKIKQHHD